MFLASGTSFTQVAYVYLQTVYVPQKLNVFLGIGTSLSHKGLGVAPTFRANAPTESGADRQAGTFLIINNYTVHALALSDSSVGPFWFGKWQDTQLTSRIE